MHYPPDVHFIGHIVHFIGHN